MSIGQRLKNIREHYRMTQAEFAEKLNVKQSYLSFVEGDKRKPTDVFLDSLYDVYRVNSEWLTKGTGPVMDGEPVEFQPVSSKQLSDYEALRTILYAMSDCMAKGGQILPPDIHANMILAYYQYYAEADAASRKEIRKHVELTFDTLYKALKVQYDNK